MADETWGQREHKKFLEIYARGKAAHDKMTASERRAWECTRTISREDAAKEDAEEKRWEQRWARTPNPYTRE